MSDTQEQQRLLCQLIVDQGIATREEVERCQLAANTQDHQASGVSSLGEILVQHQVITPNQLNRLKGQLEAQRSNQIPGYQLLSKLGSGANATVYRAKQLSLDRVVAIKVLPKDTSADEEFVERFFAEGRAAAKLNHPNIVGALDVGRVGGFAYFVMEYVEGKSVYDELVENIRIDEQDAIRIMLDVAKGLEHAHKNGLIHRDIKPQNVVLTNDGIAKITDMGLAREAPSEEEVQEAVAAEKSGNKSRVRVAVGSPNYMSPEQIRNRPDIDNRADIYSFGATFYFMVTGQVPFDAPDAIGVLKKHLREPLTDPREIHPRLTAETSEVIKVCMQKDPKDRYDSTSELVHDMQALLNGEAPLNAQLKLDPNRVVSDAESFDHVQVDLSEDSPEDDAPPLEQASGSQNTPALFEQPLFWSTTLGWLLALVFLMLWLMG